MKKILLLVALLSAPLAAKAEILAKVTAHLNAIETWQATFQQITPEQGYVTNGDFYWQRPGLFRWRYTPPSGPELIATKSGQWFYNDPQGSVTQVPKNAGWAGFLTQKEFDFSAADTPFVVQEIAEREGKVEITLLPADPVEAESAFGVQQMTLGFNAAPLKLERLVTVDQLGQKTLVLFKDVLVNASLPSEIFEFTPPHYAGEGY